MAGKDRELGARGRYREAGSWRSQGAGRTGERSQGEGRRGEEGGVGVKRQYGHRTRVCLKV